MSSNPIGDVQHPYGLPMGTVRGFMSLLICSFFWIFLVLPEGAKGPPTAPLGHFFLLTLVFLSFVAGNLVGSTVMGVVETYSSHGFYVTAAGARCYVQLAGISSPPPRSEVLLTEIRDALRAKSPA